MYYMKKQIFIILFFGLLFWVFNFVFAQEKVELYFFYSPTCPHCAEEKLFLAELENKCAEIEIKKFSTFKKENLELLEEFYKNYRVPPEAQGGVPITFIKERYFLGFDKKIGESIESYILELTQKTSQDSSPQTQCKTHFPFIGEVDISKFSPLVLAVILGTLDGFNVCSLGALVLILALVLTLRSRIKILLFGGIFILTTSIIYGILMVFWYKLFSFLAPYLTLMQILIGFLATGGAIYFLKQFFKFRKYGPTCEMEPGKGIASKFSSKIQELLKKPGNLFTIILIIFSFAAVITIVEYPCSAVVPLTFAGVLAQSQFSALQYLLYITIFILFYMLDEIIVFLIAVFTTKIWFASPKFVTWATLAEAIILFLLGIYYLFGSYFLL